ncbi:hypothetical protein GDO81_022313, partial [Engystomops pustulosus]
WKTKVIGVTSSVRKQKLNWEEPGCLNIHGPQAPSMDPNDWPMLPPGGLAFSICVTKGQRVKTTRLHKSLGLQLSEELPGSQILKLFSYNPENLHETLEKGFFILPPPGCPDAERRLCDVLVEYRKDIQLCGYKREEEPEIWQCLWDLDGGAKEITRSKVTRVEEPVSSPFVDSIKGSAVFYSLEDACDVLEESLRSHLKAELLRSPPGSINQWRSIFDSESSLIKRAYYAAGNYIGAAEIAKASKTSPVIMDRFWHSTAAYAIATEIGGGIHNLPDHHHDVYHWPDDLLKPDLVILLTVSDEERIRRIHKRGLQETKEEKELEANNMFKQ